MAANLLKQAPADWGLGFPFLTNYMTINTNQLAQRSGLKGQRALFHINQFDMPNAFKK